MERPRPGQDDDEEKLVPEWGVAADDQIVLAGVGVFVALLLLFGWNAWRGGDDGDEGDVGGLAVPAIVDGLNSDVIAAGDPITIGSTTAPPTTVADVATTTTSVATTASTTAAPSVGDVQSAVSALPGAVSGSNDGTTAILSGFVFDEAERTTAGEAAAAVEGIERVQNDLVLLDGPVLTSLDQAGVVGAAVTGTGTSVTVTGTVQSEEARTAALAEAAAIEGVTDVVDELTLSVAANLNDLPQVQFATSSADILPASFGDLDTASQLISEAGDVELEIQGYTDTRGPADGNLQLSQDRADAVRRYLIDSGVDESSLTAVGFGETDQFGPGDSDEALLANRVVLFEQVG